MGGMIGSAMPEQNQMDDQLQQLQELEQMMQQQAIDDKAEKEKLASDSSFNALINAQSIDGYWSVEQKDAILKFLDGNQKKVINDILDLAAKSAEHQLVERLVLTILANDIFTKRFQHKREEWRMIGRNVNRWMNQAR